MSLLSQILEFLKPDELIRRLRIDRLSRSQLMGLAVGLAVVLFLAGNVISSNIFRSSRVDLTENSLYSLSSGTRTLLSKLNEPIHMRLFLSKDLVQQAPQLAAYASRVQSMLDAYRDLSGGRITLEVIDPKPFSDAEDRAVGLGINRIRLTGASNEIFFGLAATNSTNGRGQIGVFSPDREPFLEYDLTRLVAELGQPKKPVIAVIDGIALSGNPMARQPESQILAQLRELFAVEALRGDIDALPENTRVLLIAHPRRLSDRTLYTIEQWVMSGGATMVFVDPHAETQPGLRPGMPPTNPKSDFSKLFEAWGVAFDTSKAVGDPTYALRTQRNIGGRVAEVANLPWLALRKPSFASDEAILAQLSSLVFTTAGSFKATSKDVKLIPLVSASSDAGLLPAADAARQGGDPRELYTKLEKQETPLIVAARLDGKISTAFDKGKPKDSKYEGKHLTAPQGKLNVILVGDADMLSDRNWVRRRNVLGQQVTEAFSNNGPFVLNAIEQMSGGTVLADLRGRGVSWRPFEKIQDLEKRAEARYLQKQQQLLAKLREAETRLRQLSSTATKDGELISAESEKAINQFRSELLSTRAQLRQVQFNLRSEVDHLKSWITMLNVGMFPAIFAALALAFAFRRPRKPLPKKTSQTTESTT
ncbi:MAG: Gldg family protein [Pseudomonadota bacterium]